MWYLYRNVLSDVYLAQIANNSEPVSLVDHLLGSYLWIGIVCWTINTIISSCLRISKAGFIDYPYKADKSSPHLLQLRPIVARAHPKRYIILHLVPCHAKRQIFGWVPHFSILKPWFQVVLNLSVLSVDLCSLRAIDTSLVKECQMRAISYYKD